MKVADYETTSEKPQVQKKKKVVEKPQVDLQTIASKANEYMQEFNEKKKKNMSIKRTMKAEKLAKKKQENSIDQEDDSSKENNENSDNSKKKKKKYRNKIKKQKTVDGKFFTIIVQ
jgi:hypothetical protein